MKKENFLILGTDVKMNACQRVLEQQGYYAECKDEKEFQDSFEDYDCIILPCPTISHSFITDTTMSFERILELISDNQTLFYANADNVNFAKNAYSYYYNENFLEENSLLTAQGVLRLILENISVDLRFLDIAILGFGRCGKSITKLLSHLDGNISVFSRKNFSDDSQRGNKIKFISIYECEKLLKEYDVIINTIPFNVIAEDTVKLFSNTIYIEVASAPYGFDIYNNDTSAFNFILASGLPGKYTPVSAGENIANTVLEILKEVKLG